MSLQGAPPGAEEGTPPTEPEPEPFVVPEAEASRGEEQLPAAHHDDEAEHVADEDPSHPHGRNLTSIPPPQPSQAQTAADLAAMRRQAALLPPSATEDEVTTEETRLAEHCAEAARRTRASGQHGEGTGIQFAGLMHIMSLLRIVFPYAFEAGKMTTSDLIKACIQPVTMPPGFIVHPEVTNADKAWYTHHYIDTDTGEWRHQQPPPGTYSLCAKLAADPATAHFISKPTHFVSHAHTMGWEETLSSLESYVSKLPPEEVATMYFWIDGFAIDQHECQYSPPSIDDNSAAWAQTFEKAIRDMGQVVMVLNPWNDPLVLSRLWCLWELHSAISTGSIFRICMSPKQEVAFRSSLLEDSGNTAILTLSGIDVNKAQGNPKDEAMIMGAIRASPGGTEALNAAAVEQLRETFVGESAREWLASCRSADGSLETAEAAAAGAAVATLLGHKLLRWEESRELWSEVAASKERLEGADAKGTLVALVQLALAMEHTGQVPEAKALYEQVLPKQIKQCGPESEDVLCTQLNLAILLRDGLEDCEGALALFDVVLSTKIKQGCDEYEIVLARSNRAITLDHLGRGTEARPEFEAVFAGRKRLLGPRHPHTMKTQDALAMLLHDQLGEKEEGLRLMREVVEVFQTVLGKEHKWTKNAKESLEAWESGQTTGRKS